MVHGYGIWLVLCKLFEDVLTLRFTDSVQVQYVMIWFKCKN
jgi:hypothetical protein